MKKYLILFMVFVVGYAIAQPTVVQNAQVFSSKVYLRGGITAYRGMTLSANNSYNNLFVVSDADSFKVRMFQYLYPLEIEIGNSQIFAVDSTGIALPKALNVTGNSGLANIFVVSDGDSTKIRMYKYLYPLEIEIGNTQKAAIDSAGNAVFAGTVSAAAFSPTATSDIQSRYILILSDGDSTTIDPRSAQYMFRIGLGGAKKFAVDSAGNAYAVSLQTPTLNGVSNAMAVTTKMTIANNYPLITTSSITADSVNITTLAGSAGAMAINTKMTIANNYPFVTNSTITADSIIVPVIAGVANAMAVNAKLNIAANYPLVSSSSIAADTLKATSGNVQIIDIDTVATAGLVKRWLKLTVTKATGAGKPETYYMVSDTTSLY